MSYSKVQNSHEHCGNVSSEYRYMCSMDNQQQNKPEKQLHNAYCEHCTFPQSLNEGCI
jgi:hypothetical protein